MSDHVPDDESCWCGVPLECHDDLYDATCGRRHRPDPIAGQSDTTRDDRSVPETMIIGGRDSDAAHSGIHEGPCPMPAAGAGPT